jgi:hypothetical protein
MIKTLIIYGLAYKYRSGLWYYDDEPGSIGAGIVFDIYRSPPKYPEFIYTIYSNSKFISCRSTTKSLIEQGARVELAEEPERQFVYSAEFQDVLERVFDIFSEHSDLDSWMCLFSIQDFEGLRSPYQSDIEHICGGLNNLKFPMIYCENSAFIVVPGKTFVCNI